MWKECVKDPVESKNSCERFFTQLQYRTAMKCCTAGQRRNQGKNFGKANLTAHMRANIARGV
jgi:hypothetical protein